MIVKRVSPKELTLDIIFRLNHLYHAEFIIPLIEKEVDRENPIVEYDELLAYEIWQHEFHFGKHTPKNTMNYGSVYEFYFGYLMGAGFLKGVSDNESQAGNY